MKSIIIFSSIMILGFGVIGQAQAITISATDSPPTTHCVTTATQKTKAAAEAQLEKDIAPYKDQTKWAAVIRQYRQELTVAWSAMEQPFCGYGPYGAASAIKSYGKSLERARAAFLAQIKSNDTTAKNLAVAAVDNLTATPKASAAVPKADSVSAKVTVKATAKSVTSVSIVRGLHFGMRSSAVRALQNLLVKHFGLPADGDHVTGYFGNVTKGLVIKFQKEKGLITSEKSPGAGLVGPKTTAALNAL